MRLNAHGRFADCAGTRCFLHTGRYFRTSTGGEPDGRRLALSEISRCRPHKSTVDTAVGRAYALTRVERGFGRVPPRLVSSSPTALPSAPLRTPCRHCIHILKVIYCRITLTAQPGPKRIKETSPLLSFLSFTRTRQGAGPPAPPPPRGSAEEEDCAATRGLASNAAFALKLRRSSRSCSGLPFISR